MALFGLLNLQKYFKKQKLPSLKERFQSFQALLEANNAALEVMGDMEGKYAQGDYHFDRRYIRDSYNQVREKVLQMIDALNSMVPDRYGLLYEVFEKIDHGIEEKVFGVREIALSPLTIPLEEVTREMGETVGGKSANLGEMRNHVGLPIPEGFAVSAYAYKIFVEKMVFGKEIKKRLAALDIRDQQALDRISHEVREAIHDASIPLELEEAIFQAYNRLSTAVRTGGQGEISVSVRSSAIKEDGDVSFAGQYATVLNVRPDRLLSAYKEVVASKFTPEAIFYWKEKGFNEEDIPMAVGCQAMICARTSGVIFSRDPSHSDPNVVIISAIWGLGELVAERASPNVYVVSKENGLLLEKRIPEQRTMLVCRDSGGVTEVPVPDELQQQPCLNEDEIKKLFRYAMLLEEYYQSPRDIEWAIDSEGKIYILQTRNLKISSGSTETKEEDVEHDPYTDRVLINWGLAAAPGVGAGPVHMVLEDRDLHPFPHGAVLVVKSTHPKYATVMDEASAIITEVGNVAGHMASLARESQVPTIVDAKDATKLLRHGQMITVDAYHNKVYDGLVQELVRGHKRREVEIRGETPLVRKVEELLSRTASLNLWDTKGGSFKPENCQTFHDLTRFMHEVAIQEMFHLHDWKTSSDKQAKQVVSDIPINLYIIDLGGGLSVPDKAGGSVPPEEIVSRPMQALWRGITHPKICWTGMVEVDLKGFASVMLNTLSDSARTGTPLGEKSYAIISKEYMNFSSRLAYHFSTVDAYCSPEVNNNYISFQFMGGGSSSERRSRRVRFIAGVLKNLDFDVEVKGDWLRARLGKYECRAIEQKLDYLGRLMCCARQLDMAMYSDNVVDWYIKAFMQGNYTFKKTVTH
ncbi:MAG TPA: PEP/pyruvate-binding domain-containing protein [Syntrophorhabdales bacterium]|nr:PEP/pyruvate-binding domain-containing protein [Syntrophorhabdales bacterium]